MLGLEKDGNYISRLESVAVPFLPCSALFVALTSSSPLQCRSDLVNSGTGVLELNLEEQGTIIAGGVAREALRE